MSTDMEPALAKALDAMWVRFLPEMKERVQVLETTAAEFAAGELSEDGQAAANTAAHKLAGVLGTFGLTRGTVLARELELMYSRENDEDAEPDPAFTAKLAQIAAELRTIVENRK
jgi:HPt (histidine-containing phosphotransfer) domain-containing protein